MSLTRHYCCCQAITWYVHCLCSTNWSLTFRYRNTSSVRCGVSSELCSWTTPAASCGLSTALVLTSFIHTPRGCSNRFVFVISRGFHFLRLVVPNEMRSSVGYFFIRNKQTADSLVCHLVNFLPTRLQCWYIYVSLLWVLCSVRGTKTGLFVITSCLCIDKDEKSPEICR